MPNPSTTTEAPANNKEKKTAYLICEGALCQCDAGTLPVKIKVTSHKKAYINGDKLLATVKDVTFEEPSAPFKSCSKNPNNNKACLPKFEQWTKPYKDIEVDGNAVITDKSELKCLQYEGTITILKHGQTQEVNADQATNMDRTIAAQVNALADLAPIAEEDKKVSVLSITGALVDDPKYKPVTTQESQSIVSITEKDRKAYKKILDSADIYVRPGQEVKFVAKPKGTESLVCWKISGIKEPVHFLQHGPVYQSSFAEVGKYTIEGYGTNGDHNLDIDTKIGKDEKNLPVKQVRADDKSCMLDILVQENKLINLRHLKSNNIIDKIKDGKLVDVQLRIGVPATFEPVFLMPPIQKEIDELILVVMDESGTELQRTKGEPKLVFIPKNSASKYTIKAYFDGTESAFISYPFASSVNSVNVIATSNMKVENEMIRPGTFMKFTVQNSKFMDDTVAPEIIENENIQIKWYENSETIAGTGPSYEKTYQKEEKYTIVCRVTEGQPGWFSKDKNDADDRTFYVTNNYPLAIEKTTAGISKIGKLISFKLKGIFEIDHSDKNSIHWILIGPETKEVRASPTFEFTPTKKGTYKLYVSMNGGATEHPFEFECTACEIVKGWWTDSDGNMLTGKDDKSNPINTLGVAGWGQEVCIAFKHIGLGDEDVTIEVWDKDKSSNTSVFKKDINVVDGYTVMKSSIKLDDEIKKNVAKKGILSDGLLYFTISAKNGLKVINNGMVLPTGEINYLKVDDTPRAIAYFADNNDTKRYSTASTDIPVYVQVKSTNLIGKELELIIYKSLNWEIDKKYDDKIAFKVDKYGMASVKLDMCIFNEEFSNPNDSISLYVNVIRKSDSEELYSSEGKYKLTLYDKLKTSPASTNTTKAFVLVDASDESYGSCGKKYCIEKNPGKNELFREINIRLAGFGGNVPTDEFTDRTEKIIKQFQRDYMQVAETGKICGSLLKAIDDFSEKWHEKISEYTCLCNNIPTIENKCSGFGKGLYKDEYSVSKEEKYHKYEHPGMHRSLLWGVSAIRFYLSIQKTFTYLHKTAGYRCWEHNIFSARETTNHMGKAVDIQFKKNNVPIIGKKNENIQLLKEIRDGFFTNFLNSKYSWVDGKNNYGLEPFGLGNGQTWSWIHLDVREFDKEYLSDLNFIKIQNKVIGKSIVDLANECGFENTCSCSGRNKLATNKESERIESKFLKISEKGKRFILEWEQFKENLHNDDSEEHHCTIGYGHLVHQGPCNGSESEEFKKNISEKRALELFNLDIVRFENAVKRDITVKLHQFEFDALVSLLYNCGENYIKNNNAPKLYKNLLDKKYDEAAAEFLDITSGELSGLVKRRKSENEMFLKNIYNSKH